MFALFGLLGAILAGALAESVLALTDGSSGGSAAENGDDAEEGGGDQTAGGGDLLDDPEGAVSDDIPDEADEALVLHGGTGDDLMSGGSAADTMTGGSGDDQLDAGV